MKFTINNKTYNELKDILYNSSNGYKFSKQIEYCGNFTIKDETELIIENILEGTKYECDPGPYKYTFHTHPIVFTKNRKHYTYANYPNILSTTDIVNTIVDHKLIDGNNIFDILVCPIGIYIYGLDVDSDLYQHWLSLTNKFIYSKKKVVENFKDYILERIQNNDLDNYSSSFIPYIGTIPDRVHTRSMNTQNKYSIKELRNKFNKIVRYHPYQQLDLFMKNSYNSNILVKKYVNTLNSIGLKTYFFDWQYFNREKDILFEFSNNF